MSLIPTSEQEVLSKLLLKDKKSALEQFKELYGDLEESPLERLRFFCSLAMNTEDWLACEEFFDDIEQDLNK